MEQQVIPDRAGKVGMHHFSKVFSNPARYPTVPAEVM